MLNGGGGGDGSMCVALVGMHVEACALPIFDADVHSTAMVSA